MKSVIGTIIVFILLYLFISNAVIGDVLNFFAQKSFSIFAVGSVVAMLIVSVIVLGFPKKKGGHHEKDKHLDT